MTGSWKILWREQWGTWRKGGLGDRLFLAFLLPSSSPCSPSQYFPFSYTKCVLNIVLLSFYKMTWGKITETEWWMIFYFSYLHYTPGKISSSPQKSSFSMETWNVYPVLQSMETSPKFKDGSNNVLFLPSRTCCPNYWIWWSHPITSMVSSPIGVHPRALIGNNGRELMGLYCRRALGGGGGGQWWCLWSRRSIWTLGLERGGASNRGKWHGWWYERDCLFMSISYFKILRIKDD